MFASVTVQLPYRKSHSDFGVKLLVEEDFGKMQLNGPIRQKNGGNKQHRR